MALPNLDAPSTYNPFIHKYLRRQNQIPFGYFAMNVLNEAITASQKINTPVEFITGTKPIVNMIGGKVFVDGRKLTKINKLKCEVLVVSASRKLELNNIDCKYLIVIGGAQVSIRNSKCFSMFIYGVNKLIIENVMIARSAVNIVDDLVIEGRYYYANNSLFACMNLDIKSTTTLLEDKFYLIGLGALDINTMSTELLDKYKNLYMGTMNACSVFSHGFKIEPYLIHKRITWLIWALYDFDWSQIRDKQCHMQLLWDKDINNSPEHLRMTRFVHERNIYLEPFSKQEEVAIDDIEHEAFILSSKRADCNAFDLIPAIFAARFGIAKPNYRIKISSK